MSVVASAQVHPHDVAVHRRPPVLELSALLAMLFGFAGLAYRIWLLANGMPAGNGDEATMGLAALHVSRGVDAPVFFYGQHYMGALEAYAAAPFFGVFGSGWGSLRAPLVVFYALFLVSTYLLTRRVYSPWLATLVVGLLALGAHRQILNQLIAAGGYPELLPLGSAAVLLAFSLGTGWSRHRWLGFACWGLVVGLVVWVDWLAAPYLLAAVAILLAGCWRELWGRAGLAVLVGALLGALPSVLFNVAHPGENSLTAYLDASGGADGQSLSARVHGGVGMGVALANGLCPPGHCGRAQTHFSYLYVGLLVAAVLLGAWALYRRRAGGATDPVAAPQQRAERLRSVTRIALALAALLTIVLFVRNATAATSPIASARYLSCLQISTAAALWPLWLLARRVPDLVGAGRNRAARLVPLMGGLAGLVAGLVMVALVVGGASATVATARIAPQERADRNRVKALVEQLRGAGIHEVYSDYETCGKISFVSAENTVCVSLGDGLAPVSNRYQPIVDRVTRAVDPAYVVPAGRWLDRGLSGYFRDHGVSVVETDISGYRIYRAATPPGEPIRN